MYGYNAGTPIAIPSTTVLCDYLTYVVQIGEGGVHIVSQRISTCTLDPSPYCVLLCFK